MPFEKTRFSMWLVGVVFAICIGLPLLWDIPGHWRLLRYLQNSGHSLLFLAMAYTLALHGVKWFKTTCSLLVLGSAIELVQLFIGKDCDLQDVGQDGLGIAAGLLLHRGFSHRSLLWPALAMVPLSVSFSVPAAIALSYVWQWRSFPVLVDFEDYGRKYLIETHEGAVYALSSWGNGEPKPTTALKLTCPVQNWPGVALVDLAPDWHGYDSLQLDVWSFEEHAIRFGVALRGLDNHSDHHDISRSFELTPGANQLIWPLQEILKNRPGGAHLLTSINKVVLFCMPEQTRIQPSHLLIDNLVLNRNATDRHNE